MGGWRVGGRGETVRVQPDRLIRDGLGVGRRRRRGGGLDYLWVIRWEKVIDWRKRTDMIHEEEHEIVLLMK